MKFVELQIKSIQNTVQITKAVELVASSKLWGAEEKVETNASYFSAFWQTLINIAAENMDYTSVYARKNQSHGHYYMLIAGDHGMMGGYNINLSRAFKMESREKEFVVLPLDRKTRNCVAQKRLGCLESEKMMVASTRISDCYTVARRLYVLFRTGESRHTSLLYIDFVSLMKQESGSSSPLLPVDFKNEGCTICGKEGEEKERTQNLISYEPSAGEVYDTIVPEYLVGLLHNAVAGSLANEHAVCRAAVKAATDNTGETIDKLSLYYNRARQASITQEITGVVSDAEGSNGWALIKEKF